MIITIIGPTINRSDASLKKSMHLCQTFAKDKTQQYITDKLFPSGRTIG